MFSVIVSFVIYSAVNVYSRGCVWIAESKNSWRNYRQNAFINNNSYTRQVCFEPLWDCNRLSRDARAAILHRKWQQHAFVANFIRVIECPSIIQQKGKKKKKTLIHRPAPVPMIEIDRVAINCAVQLAANEYVVVHLIPIEI